MKTLNEVLGSHFAHLKFDKKLAKSIYKFQLDYLNSNRDYLDFYSTNMLGIHRLRFKVSDTNKFMLELLEIDTDQLDKDLDDVPSVVKINSVTSDLFNISCMYLIHRFMNSNAIGESDKKRAIYDIASLFFMRAFAALISSYFTYPAEERIVKVAYSNLSGNSLIKKLGNWYKVVDYRANRLIEVKSIHYKTLKNLVEDNVAYAISDSRDRVKDTIINYYREIVKVRDSGDTIGVLSSMAMNEEGILELVDKVNKVEQKTLEIRNLIVGNGFINNDYVHLIVNMNRNTSTKALRETLEWTVNTYMSKGSEIDKLIGDIAIYVQHLLSNKLQGTNERNIGKLLLEIRNIYSSNKIQDVELDRIKATVDAIIVSSVGKKINKSLAVATRTAYMLYISLMIIK